MKILITGANGQLGTEVQRQLREGGSALGPLPQRLHLASVIPVDIEDGDLTDRHEAAVILRRYAPDAVIHCAAYTNVDACEDHFDDAFAVNALAARNVAMGCEEIGAKMLHISTDYVFSGQGSIPFSEASLTAPQSAYGRSKLLGEEYVKAFCSRWIIIRTSWLYGRTGKNFVRTIVNAAKEKGSLKVVNDQLGNPTNAEDLAHHILSLSTTKEYGLYHCTGGGICSWYDFAKEIVRLWGIDATVSPCTTEEFGSATKRPAYSALEHSMLRATIGDSMRPWQEALAHFYEEMKDSL